VIRVDYHFHTDASYDARVSPEAALEQAERAGLRVLCVTDHDTIDGAVRLHAIQRPSVQIVVGCEFTTGDGSHIIGLNLTDMVEEKGTFALLEKIRLQGGLVLLPHPFRRGSGIFRNEVGRPPEFVERVLTLADMVECFNGRDTWENNRRNHLLATEQAVGAVAGSDAHQVDELGSVFVEYEEGPFRHGASARRVFFPSQTAVAEHPAKRKALEMYHRHKDRLPQALNSLYRTSRAWMKRDAPSRREVYPRLQYELPPSFPRGGRP
jgi:hypothetical protein